MDLHSALHDKLLLSTRYLTREQQDLVTQDGNCVVRACPGSGKTRALAARLAYRMSTWDSKRAGIAALSFTNVAVDELKNGLRILGIQMPGTPPHFVGTIDSFIYQNITGPHLSAVIKNMRSRPELILHGQDGWVEDIPQFCVQIWIDGGKKKFPYKVPVTRYFLKPDGSITWNPSTKEQRMKIRLPDAGEVRKKKLSLARSGHISISDSMFYAYWILKRFPQLAEGLASRYPEIVIDECQDTSAVQDEIVSVLVATARTSVAMIGDPFQAIYEFNDANPQLMLSRICNDGWKEIRLNDNFRSSQKICDGVTKLFDFSEAMTSRGKYEQCLIEPIALRYEDRDVGALSAKFAEIIEALGNRCSFAESKIVARSTNAVRELRRLAGEIDSTPNYCTMCLMTAAACRDEGLWSEAFRSAQACLCRLAFDRATLGPGHEALGDMDYRSWRRLVWAVVAALPNADETLNAWIPQARDSLKQKLAEVDIVPRHRPSDRLKCLSNCPSISVSSVVLAGGLSAEGHHIDTVHKVKGQTLDGIMLVASPKDGPRKSSVYGWLPNGKDVTEERRIAYVAMSRPSKLLVVAIPNSAWDDCAPHFGHFRLLNTADVSPIKDLCRGCPLQKD